MNYTIIHPDASVVDSLTRLLGGRQDISAKIAVFQNLAKSLTSKDAVVAPGNSFGLMDGGFDQAIIDAYGLRIQQEVQDKIAKYYFGELPVGCAVAVPPKHNDEPYIIYAPTMQVPQTLHGSSNVYYAMMAALREARDLPCDQIVLPLLGAGVGQLSPRAALEQMVQALDRSKCVVAASDLTWPYALARHSEWHRRCGIPE